MSANTTKLDFWVANNYNILFIGKHGVGKTAIVKETFDRHQLKWRYFSASTMDPWVDFVGIPKERNTSAPAPKEFEIIRELSLISTETAREWVVKNWSMDPASASRIVSHALGKEEGRPYLDLVRPHAFATDQIEALFFDEFNRSHMKVRNAVMELIQFRSINGVVFPNLRFVWAAINPDDDDVNNYDVEKLDPALIDRFHATIEVPYKPSAEWFRVKYGRRVADSAIGWWDELTDEEKNKVSPRRLQYALDAYTSKGDIRDILPVSCNVSKLIQSISNGPITEKLETLFRTNNTDEAIKFLENENNFSSAIRYILKSEVFMGFFSPLMPKEKISAYMDSDEKFCSHVINHLGKKPVFHSICKEIVQANQNAKMCKKIRNALTDHEELKKAFHDSSVTSTEEPIKPMHTGKKHKSKDYASIIAEQSKAPLTTAAQRIGIFEAIESNMPSRLCNEDARATLKLLNSVFSSLDEFKTAEDRSKWQFSSVITQKPFANLIGMINNCINSMALNNSCSCKDALGDSSKDFPNLYEKIITAGLSQQLLQGE